MEEDKTKWNSAASRLEKTIKSFSNKMTTNYQGRLFAKDAIDGLRLIDMTRTVFDIVVMNPPFGALSNGSKEYLTKTYPYSKSDLLSIFVERGLELLGNGGRLAAITSRTPFFLKSYEKWREQLILKIGEPEVMADLGNGVMDEAFVEAAAFVSKETINDNFLKNNKRKGQIYSSRNACFDIRNGNKNELEYNVDIHSIEALPGKIFSYWIRYNAEKYLKTYLN